MEVLLGVHDLRNLTNVEVIAVENSVTYPGYESDSSNDIMLLKLVRPVKFTHKIYPICLATTNHDPNSVCYVTGVGIVEISITIRIYNLYCTSVSPFY